MQPDTQTKFHQWMQMSITPVEVMGYDANGEPVAIPTMEPDVRFGCFKCLAPLTRETQHAECTDPLDEDHQGLNPDEPPIGV